MPKVHYGVRPAKAVQRRMVLDLLSRLGRIHRLDRYRYVGFGGIGFVDYELIHRRFGITNMVSLESDDSWRPRASLNMPHHCIRMEWRSSHDCLHELSWRRPSIVWLDYECGINRQVLGDLEIVASRLKPRSFLCITLNVRPPEFQLDVPIADRRLEKFTNLVGANRVPPGLTGGQLSGWQWSSAVHQVELATLREHVADRNVSTDLPLGFHQFIRMEYADTHKMLTIGGLIGTDEDRARFLGLDNLDDLFFVRREAEEAFRVRIPKLTLRELQYLARRLPNPPSAFRASALPHEEILKFREIYRYHTALVTLESL